jgi:hypothetical protein
MISDEEGKAVQEIAKVAGRSIDAGREMGGFIAKYLGAPLEQAMGIWTDKLKYLRWENQIRLVDRAQTFLHARGLDAPTRPVALSLAIPLLEEGSLADSNEIQDRWAMLLANAADAKGPEIRRAYVGILSEMTALDASLLEKIYDADAAFSPIENMEHAELWTGDLPRGVRVATREDKATPPVSPEFGVALVNLGRLGLIDSAAAFGGMANMNYVAMTELGRHFVNACRPAA